MRLVSAVLGFLLRKLGVLVAMVLALFLGYLLIQALVPALREAVTDRDRLQQVAGERAALEEDLEQLRSTARQQQYDAIAVLQVRIEAEIEQGRDDLADGEADVERQRDDRDEVCGFVQDLIDLVTPGSACKAAEAALEKAEEVRDTLEANLDQAQDAAAVIGDPNLTTQQKLDRLGEGGDASLEREIDNTESQLAQKKAEQRSLKESQSSVAGWVVDRWAQSWRWLAVIALLALVLPGVLRTVSYFVLMPVVTRMHRPIHLAAGLRDRDCTAAHLRRPADPDDRAGGRRGAVRPVGARTSGAGPDPQPPPLRLVVAVHQLRGRALRAEPHHRRRAHQLRDARDARTTPTPT